MKLNIEVDKYLLAALFFLCLQAALLIKSALLNDFELLYYFCYHAPILFAIAFYKKDIPLIRGIIITGVVGQGIWSADYLSFLLSGRFLFGFSSSLLQYQGFIYMTTLLSHVASSFLALLLIKNEALPKKSLLYAFCYFLFFYSLSLLRIIPESANVNLCVVY